MRPGQRSTPRPERPGEPERPAGPADALGDAGTAGNGAEPGGADRLGSPLDPAQPYKPLDVGNGIVSGTVSGSGRLLSIGITHPEHGRVVLTDAPPFPEDRRGDPTAVRAYRAALADPGRAGAGFGFAAEAAEVRLRDDRIPVARGRSGGAVWEITTFAPAGRTGIVQLVRGTGRLPDDTWIWTGALRLGRAAYTQLTEGGPLAPAPAAPETASEGDLTTFFDPALGAAAALVVRPPTPSGTDRAGATDGGGWTAVAAAAIATDLAAAATEALALADGAAALLAAEAPRTIRPRSAAVARSARGGPVGAAESSGPAATPADETVLWPVRRAVHYTLDCAVTRPGDGLIAILADHELLPLVWTRDAYFVCALLDALAPTAQTREVVPSFVRWLYTVAERPGGWWPRASLASGQAKDRAFQLDQQVYPVLLAHRTGLFTAEAAAVLDKILARRTPFGLVATDETPADDRLTQPYHFSSHVLLWHALATVRHPAAEAVRAATLAHFGGSAVAGLGFAYAISGPEGDGARGYHDANDLPTALAPAWGFCAADDPRWHRTVERAWSTANPGYVAAPPAASLRSPRSGGSAGPLTPAGLAGLGSLHTLHPWPLGDLQARIVAAAQGDRRGVAHADARLERVQTWDGLLPEAYDEWTGAVASRHWFAWPAALRAWLLLQTATED